MCISTLENLSNAEASGISFVKVIATQSPSLARIANGSDLAGSAYVAALSCARTKSLPSGSTKLGVRWIDLPIATTLQVRSLRPAGHRPSVRFANGSVELVAAWAALLPRYGDPLWPTAVNGGRFPMLARNIGYAGLPLLGSNKTAGRSPTRCPASTASRLGWPGMTCTESGNTVGSPGAPRYSGAALVPAIFQSQTFGSWPSRGTPEGGSCGRIQASRLFLVSFTPL